jgi:ATP-dependent Lon protease
VRGLEREIARVCRKVVKEKSLNKDRVSQQITPADLEKYAGVHKFDYGKAEESDAIGQVNGLAWTQVGGELLTIEAVAIPGKGKTIMTGSLGDIMQESIQAALTVVRSRAASLGIDENFQEHKDLHVPARA